MSSNGTLCAKITLISCKLLRPRFHERATQASPPCFHSSLASTGRFLGRCSIHVEAGVVGGDAGPLAGAFRSLRFAGPFPKKPTLLPLLPHPYAIDAPKIRSSPMRR